MSSLKAFAVFDVKANAYLAPMFFPTNGTAIRAFSAAVQEKSHQFCKFPEDYSLCELGEFDESLGSFKSLKAPVTLCKALDFVEVNENRVSVADAE